MGFFGGARKGMGKTLTGTLPNASPALPPPDFGAASGMKLDESGQAVPSGIGPSEGLIQGQLGKMPPWEQVQQQTPRFMPGMMQKTQDFWNSPQGQNAWSQRMQANFGWNKPGAPIRAQVQRGGMSPNQQANIGPSQGFVQGRFGSY